MKKRHFAFLVIIYAITFLFVWIARADEGRRLTASWYSIESLKKEGTWALTKGRMANGEMFADEGYTCASWDYAFGSILDVYNLSNGKRVNVRVTDRTARRFKGKRIDLSARAFDKIADRKQGLVEVYVIVLKDMER